MKLPKGIPRRWYALLLMLAVFCGCGKGFPRDPDKSLERIRGGQLRIGITANPPYAIIEGGAFSGSEVEIMNSYAKHHNATIAWREGAETELVELLIKRELDFVVGGFLHPAVWKESGFTRPYMEQQILVGVRGQAMPESIKNQPVAVLKRDDIDRYVLAHKGKPVVLDSLTGYTGLAAGTANDLAAAGFSLSNMALATEKHIIGVAQGENALLVDFERFLESQGYMK